VCHARKEDDSCTIKYTTVFYFSGVARISKLGGHTGDVARRADAGVRFLGRGSAAGALPIS